MTGNDVREFLQNSWLVDLIAFGGAFVCGAFIFYHFGKYRQRVEDDRRQQAADVAEALANVFDDLN